MSRMTQKEYREFCEKFFKENEFWSSKENVQTYASALTLDEFQKWKIESIHQYDKHAIVLIQELVATVRAAGDSIQDDVSQDPLTFKKNKNLIHSYREIYDAVFDENFWSLPVVMQRNQDWIVYLGEKAKEDALNVEVNGEKFKALAMCPVLWSGWECDTSVWVVEHEGQKKLVNSSHGTTSFTNKDFLEGKIKEYEQAIDQSKKMLSLLEK